MPLREMVRPHQIQRFLSLAINEEKELRDIVQIAAEICQIPTALITLLNEDTGEVLLQISNKRDSIEKKNSFSTYVIQQRKFIIIKDSGQDNPVNNTFESSDASVRFYAGTPLITPDGHCLGSLCVMAQEPGDLTSTQINILDMLSKQAIRILEFKLSIGILKQQYIQAKESETKMRSFFESTASCHLLLGPDFRILDFNKALEKFVNDNLNVQVSEGIDVRTIVHQSYKEGFLQNYKTALDGTRVISEVELNYTGKLVYWYIVYEPAYSASGDIIGVSYNATDITERIRQEQIVITQNKSLKEIAFIQSHELRRPVSSIMGLMDLIESEDYMASRQDMILLKQITAELDSKIRKIVDFTANLKLER